LFYVKVADGNCEQIDSVAVKAESININLTGDLELCEGDSVFLILNNLNPTIPILSYYWFPSDVIYAADSASIKDFSDTSSWYSVEVINEDGCIIKDSVFVNIYEYPISDSLWLNEDTVFRGEKVIVTIQTDDFINWIEFNNSDSILKDYPEIDYCYRVQIYNQFNCLISDSICVTVLDVFCDEDRILIPTAFSPNEDENFLNETYFIEDRAGIIIDFRLEIFNRLGQKVFSTTDINIKWDGTYRGKKLNPQVFDFYLELKCVGDKQLFRKGNITLIR
jgi:gliding motility-associated-like protein